MDISSTGAFSFGLVIGWVTYRTLRRKEGNAALSDIAGVVGAVGGGAVTARFGNSALFAWYAIGLAIGFFLYLIVSLAISGRAEAGSWMRGGS